MSDGARHLELAAAAGGDGSLGPVAAVAMQQDVPFVCVPTGTRNHFAHDLGLNRAKPLAALAAFTGIERRVGAARVGDRVFLNNVSLGSYAELVREPGYRAHKLATTRAVLPGALRGERAGLPVRVHDPKGRAHDRPLVLLVANNRYDLRHPFHLGARHQLDAGLLHVAVLSATTGARFAALLGRFAVGNYVAGARWAEWTSTAVRVESGVDRVPAGIDGEAAVLDTPMEFRTLPLALRVLLPPGTPTSEASVHRRPPLDSVPHLRRVRRAPVTTSSPSRHAASATAFTTGVALESPELAVPVGVLAAAVAWSRVWTGAHYPGDITAGALLGVGLGLALARVRPGHAMRGSAEARTPPLTSAGTQAAAAAWQERKAAIWSGAASCAAARPTARWRASAEVSPSTSRSTPPSSR